MIAQARRHWCAGIAMVLVAIAVHCAMYEPIAVAGSTAFEQSVPARFGSWTAVTANTAPVGLTQEEKSTRSPYDDVLLRSYSNGSNVVTLALAYGRNQRQEVKIHPPELCYKAQGFAVLATDAVPMMAAGVVNAAIPGRRMVTRSSERTELVSYWIRVGDLYNAGSWQTRWYLLREGLRRKAHDGVLVRVSQPVVAAADAGAAFAIQENFLREFLQAMPLDQRAVLAY